MASTFPDHYKKTMANISDTQKESWDSLQPTLGEKQKAVLDVINIKPSTLFEIACTLRWPVNRVSGRISELRDAGLIVDTGLRRVNPDSGKRGIIWGTPRPVDSEFLF